MSSPRLPFVLIGDAPDQLTGRSRLAGDLAARIWADREALGVDLLHVGQVPWGPLPSSGMAARLPVPWPCWVFHETPGQESCHAAVMAAIQATFPSAPGGILFAAQDPARSYELTTPVSQPDGWSRWAYIPMDGHNRQGGIGGPAAEVIRTAHRVLAAGPYGQGVLARVRQAPVEALPHGYDPSVFRPDGAVSVSPERTLGCVATNTARKDIPLFLEVLAALRRRDLTAGTQTRGWLHIDEEIGEAWSVPQLAADLGLGWGALEVSVRLSELEMARRYRACWATLAVGKGEGFGYPILESLACGTRVWHVDYAEGASLLPESWRLPVVAEVPTGPYGILRPVVDALTTAQTMSGAHAVDPGAVAALAAPYAWPGLWPRWREWLLAGLEEVRRG